MIYRTTGYLRSLNLGLNSRSWGPVDSTGIAGLFNNLVKHLIHLYKIYLSSRERRCIRLIKMINAINDRPCKIVIRLRNKNTGLIISGVLSTW